MSETPEYEEIPFGEGTFRVDRHALEVGLDLTDTDRDDLVFVGRLCSEDDITREKILLAFAVLDDISPEEEVPGISSDHGDLGVLFARDKLVDSVLDVLTQDDTEIQLRLFINWFNREIAGMSVDGPIIDEFEDYADRMRDRAGVNIARTLYENDDLLEGLELDLNEEMAKTWDPEPEQNPEIAVHN